MDLLLPLIGVSLIGLGLGFQKIVRHIARRETPPQQQRAELLAREPEVSREKFRRAPLGTWETAAGLVPMGDLWEFRDDGSGELVECRGFGHRKIPFAWREAGDLKIALNFDKKILYENLECTDDDLIDDESSSETEDNDWEPVSYDFKVITVHDNVAAYEAVVMTGFWWSLDPLVFIGESTPAGKAEQDALA